MRQKEEENLDTDFNGVGNCKQRDILFFFLKLVHEIMQIMYFQEPQKEIIHM